MNAKDRGYPEKGYYTHFKGSVYFVLGLCGVHTETKEKLVIYQRAAEPLGEHWARPLKEFNEEVVWPDGRTRSRFIRGSHVTTRD